MYSHFYSLIQMLIAKKNFYVDLIKLINKHKIINEINNMKKFNLDKKNLLISIEGILKNEAR